MHDAICISDIHLGADNCQAKLLNEFLHHIPPTKELIINGDLFDSIDFRRLRKHHWRILTSLRKLSEYVKLTWIRGNHDEAEEIISHLIGATVYDKYIVNSGDLRILFVHGDAFDKFISEHPFITTIADLCYIILQKIDPSCYFAKLAKRSSKTFLRCVTMVEEGACKQAKAELCNYVVTGHTHHPYIKLDYANSGCWTEIPCSYITISEGEVNLCHFPSNLN
jgi:UDP-2,3-diacylglucosamine pyrophosphatase LpxH